MLSERPFRAEAAPTGAGLTEEWVARHLAGRLDSVRERLMGDETVRSLRGAAAESYTPGARRAVFRAYVGACVGAHGDPAGRELDEAASKARPWEMAAAYIAARERVVTAMGFRKGDLDYHTLYGTTPSPEDVGMMMRIVESAGSAVPQLREFGQRA